MSLQFGPAVRPGLGRNTGHLPWRISLWRMIMSVSANFTNLQQMAVTAEAWAGDDRSWATDDGLTTERLDAMRSLFQDGLDEGERREMRSWLQGAGYYTIDRYVSENEFVHFVHKED